MIDNKRIKQRAKRIRPLLLPLILYSGLILIAARWAPQFAGTVWGYIIALLPMIPGLFLAVGAVRITAELDEMERRILQEAVTFSFVFTLLILVSLGLLEFVGVQQPGVIFIALLMCVLLVIGKLWGNWRYR